MINVIIIIMTTIAISETTRKELLRFASELQIKLGRKVNYDEALKHILFHNKSLKPDLLKEACKEHPEVNEIILSLYEERKRDEVKYERYLRG
jgi:hypothetical protein